MYISFFSQAIKIYYLEGSQAGRFFSFLLRNLVCQKVEVTKVLFSDIAARGEKKCQFHVLEIVDTEIQTC